MQPNTDPVYLASQGLSKTFPERFLSKLNPPDSNGCITWSGAKMWFGYGEIQKGIPPHRPMRAHIASWILFKGPIPKGMCVLHNCPIKHNPSCINPDHLKLGNHSQNMQDMVKNGTHYFSNNPSPKGENSYSAKLTQAQGDEIRSLYAGGVMKQIPLAKKFGVSQATIWNVLHNVTLVRQ